MTYGDYDEVVPCDAHLSWPYIALDTKRDNETVYVHNLVTGAVQCSFALPPGHAYASTALYRAAGSNSTLQLIETC